MKKSVLVIDDDESDLNSARRTLSKIEGLDITTSECARTSLAADKRHDLIFLDINMPGMDGKEFLREYRQKGREKGVVVMLTSSSYRADVKECYKLGANAYVCKPYELSELEEALKISCRFWLQIAEKP